MTTAIDAVRVRGDSIGGVVTCIVRNAPCGLGLPVFHKLEAELARASDHQCKQGGIFNREIINETANNDARKKKVIELIEGGLSDRCVALREFKLVTKEICKLPSFFSPSLFRKVDVNCSGLIIRRMY